jgi:hypothetical protein
MRIAAILLALMTSAATAAPGISDEFAAGFGGVPWGIELAALIAQFPGGYVTFSTAPGGLHYTLNIDDPVLGISRVGEHVTFEIGTDLKVMYIEIQVPYDQASALIEAVTTRFGPAKTLEVDGAITVRHWPTYQGFGINIRTTDNRAYGLTSLSITNLRPRPAVKSSGARPG